MKRFRQGAVLAVLLLCLLCLFACEGGFIVFHPAEEESGTPDLTEAGTGSPSETSAEPRPITAPVTGTDRRDAAAEAVRALPDRDMEGIAAVIATTDLDTYQPDGDTVISAARRQRNQLVEDKYNTTILVNSMSSSDLYRQVKESALAGMYFCDLLAVPQRTLGIFSASDLLFNLNSLPYTSFGASCYNTDAIEQMSAGSELFAVSGALNENPDYCYAVFFDRPAAETLGLDLYGAVRDGTWTWETFREAARTACTDLNDMSGFAYNTTASVLIDTVFASSGERYVTAGRGTVPTLNEPGDRAERVAAIAAALLYGDGSVLPTITDEDQSSSFGSFYSGRSLFFLYRLGAAGWFKNMTDSFGLLPLPKLDEAQDGYYSYLDPESTVICVPASTASSENTGYILQALNVASEGWLTDAYGSYMADSILRDNDSLLMLDRILSHPVYDFANLFAVSLGKMENATRFAVRSAVKLGIPVREVFDNHAASATAELASTFGR